MSNLKEQLARIDELEKKRQFPAALEAAQQAVKSSGGERRAAIRLAQMSEICKQYKPALAMYRRLHEEGLKAGSTEFDVVMGMARTLFHTDRLQEAESVLQQLEAQLPNHPDVLAWQAALARQANKWPAVRDYAERALETKPGHKKATFELGQYHLNKEEYDTAISLFEANVKRSDLDGESIDAWLATLDKLDRNRYAQDTLEDLATKYPDTVEFVYGFAVLANKAGEITLARPWFERALQLSPDNNRILYDLGVLERVAGNLDRSQELIGRALQMKPDNPAALRTYGSDTKYQYGDENFKRLNFVAANFTEFSEGEQIHLHYALAKAYEDVEELDTAYRHYALGGEKKRKASEYDEREAFKLNKIIQQVVTPQNLQLAGQRGSSSELPVFILGMPRSGTSLIEQILSSHPDIFGAGELKFLTGVLENISIGKGLRLKMGDRDPVFPYEANASWAERGDKYVEKLRKLASGDYKRVVDKMPGNFNFVGLIHAVLPNARIIHSRRHPVETCLSCYRIHFAEGHQWTYNLRELGRYYKRYWELMQYWREAFPGVMYEIRYEDNVADVEGQARKLIAHLGLDWNDRCLEFYKTERPVKTASLTQVRKPIYNTSTNRWRKYEKYLGPLLEELGDIVPQYEAEIEQASSKSS